MRSPVGAGGLAAGRWRFSEKSAAENEGKIKVGKVNVDENPDLARKYRVMSIPTVLVFKNGELTATSVGVDSKENILKLLEK